MKLLVSRKYSFWQIVQLGLFFLISLNFVNLYFYLIFAAFFICVITNVKRFKFDIASVLLVLFSVCYILFYPPTRESYTSILKQFAYPMCYMVGLNLFFVDEDKNNNSSDAQIKLCILTVAMGTFLHYLLNASINIDSLLRNTVDYWTGEVVVATDQALLVTMAIGVFSVWLCGDSKMWKKVFSLLGLILVFVYNFVLAGRTIILLSAITMFIAFMFIQKHTSSGGRIRRYLFLSVALFGVLLLFLNNVWGIRDWILDSNLSNRFEAQDYISDIRVERKLIYISRMLDFPFGGGGLRDAVGGHAHELYLDVLSDVGFIGYVLVGIVVLIGNMSAFRAFRIESLSIETRNLILCVFVGVNIVFFLEPIIQGEPWLFCIFCFLIGVMRSQGVMYKQQV